MKAAVCYEFGKPLIVEEVNLRAPKYGEVEVKMRACAICHSDILFAEGAWGGTLDGGLLEHGMATATFAERAVVDQSQIVRIPEEMSMDVASLFSCGVITGVGAVTNTAKVRPGSSVVVIGAGGVGLNTIQGAVICGAVKIVAVDMTEEKLDAAREFGATHGVLATEEKMHRKIQQITDGRGADYVFITVGVTQAYESAP
jgi:S-(hydroxymethyl)glutathione dehydrogenase/alcohol dehydrogenase